MRRLGGNHLLDRGGGANAWETKENWSEGAIPGADSDVVIESSSGVVTISASTELQKFHSLLLNGTGEVAFGLGPAAKMTTSGGVTNFCSTTYEGGGYAFGDEMVVGYAKGWQGEAPPCASAWRKPPPGQGGG